MERDWKLRKREERNIVGLREKRGGHKKGARGGTKENRGGSWNRV